MILKPKTISEFFKYFSGKPTKYLKKQYENIQTFGVTRQYSGVSDQILDKYTPYRRLSKKKCTLSDSNYFIRKFETESSREIPKIWDKMSEHDKIDFIVKNRYERLVSNRIMNDISKSKVEKSFVLSTDGKIKYYGTYNSSTHCPVPTDLAKDSICIHNHPIQFTANGWWTYSDLNKVNRNARPFSAPDFANCIWRGAKKTYVVDSKGVKFQFIPNYEIPKAMGIDFYTSNLRNDLYQIQLNSFERFNDVEQALSDAYTGMVKRIKQDGHDFKILNFFEKFDKW